MPYVDRRRNTVMTAAIPVTRIDDLHRHVGAKVRLQGWLVNRRGSGKVLFLHVRDGSGFVQCVMGAQDVAADVFEAAKKLGQESSIIIEGTVRADERAPYIGMELTATDLVVLQQTDSFPIQKKGKGGGDDHDAGFLMEHRHLWMRDRRQWVILRVRHTIVKAIRDYFDSRGFVLVDSPIFTANACEGTTTLFETKWFDESTAYLSQSGQLYQEATALAFGKTYCFGPTFRAEKSKTRRHLNEFWMVEPEVAFMDMYQDMDMAEDFLRSVVGAALQKHEKELREILPQDADEKTWMENHLRVLQETTKPFARISYDEAVRQIQAIANEPGTTPEQKKLLEIEWGMDFGSPHETELTKRYQTPIIVYGFPAAVKAFYMKKDPQRPEVAMGFDVLAPEGYGEIIGGGQREDNLQLLEKEVERHKLDVSVLGWYFDLRKYGSVPHAGFGLGVERTVAWVCGLHHVRETIPFARTLDRIYP
jgi:asparaginyl-tRNA synthetase